MGVDFQSVWKLYKTSTDLFCFVYCFLSNEIMNCWFYSVIPQVPATHSDYEVYWGDGKAQQSSSTGQGMEHFNCTLYQAQHGIRYGTIQPDAVSGDILNHWGRVTHVCQPSHYLNKCWDIVNCTLKNKIAGHFDLARHMIQSKSLRVFV